MFTSYIIPNIHCLWATKRRRRRQSAQTTLAMLQENSCLLQQLLTTATNAVDIVWQWYCVQQLSRELHRRTSFRDFFFLLLKSENSHAMNFVKIWQEFMKSWKTNLCLLQVSFPPLASIELFLQIWIKLDFSFPTQPALFCCESQHSPMCLHCFNLTIWHWDFLQASVVCGLLCWAEMCRVMYGCVGRKVQY